MVQVSTNTGRDGACYSDVQELFDGFSYDITVILIINNMVRNRRKYEK